MNIIRPIPKKLYLAISGGVDSMVALHFLLNGRKDVKCLYFNHGTKFGDECESFLKDSVDNLICKRLDREMDKGRSLEDFWREARYEFFDEYSDRPVVTCHHLNDQIETFIQGIAHGRTDRLIPYERGNYIRPFLNVPKLEIVEYAARHGVKCMLDPSNENLSFTRNRVRHKIIPELLSINSGLYKSMKKIFDAQAQPPW